jgi:class 3 adenylate cyclase/Tfp pilus assembly protein PilF
MWNKFLLFVIFICCFSVSIAQVTKENKNELFRNDTALVHSLLIKSKELFAENPEEAIKLNMQARDIASTIGYEKGLATALKTIGNNYYNQSKHIEALDYWNQSLRVFEQIKDDVGVSNMLSNIGVVYMDQGDDEKALEYNLKSLKIAEKTGDKLRIVTAMNNIGAIYYHKKETHDKALHYYLQALKLNNEIDDQYGIGTIAANIGEIYFEKKDYASALNYYKQSMKAYEKGSPEDLPYPMNAIGKVFTSTGGYIAALSMHERALSLSKKIDNKQYIAQSFLGIADAYKNKKDLKSAIASYLEAEVAAKEANSLHELKIIYEGLAISYAATSDFKNAFKYQALFTSVINDLYNIEADKKLVHLQFDFDLQKKQGQIDLLTKDQTLKEVQLKRQMLERNTLIIGLSLVLLIAILIFRNYRIKVKTNKILDKQKVEIESLLLNILPAEVAKELQVTGKSKPREYDLVSVLFTDFKGFTSIADKMSPQDLVEELSSCFVAFDTIIEKNNLEKIKTIGDSYMCAGGIPTLDNQHPFNIVKAGLEIQKYIIENNKQREESGLVPWEIRIGIHVGPIVAGVVGKKKYAYDIWGSTVNIASRMESSGVPGQVNISASVYEIIKEKYNCIYRGKIYAKNVGDVDMYLIDAEKGESGKIITDVENKVELINKTDHPQKSGSTLLQ